MTKFVAAAPPACRVCQSLLPLDPILGTGGSGVTNSETNATVHIHRGSIGDDSADGGNSDIVNSVHRWLNPVAKVTVTVN